MPTRVMQEGLILHVSLKQAERKLFEQFEVTDLNFNEFVRSLYLRDYPTFVKMFSKAYGEFPFWARHLMEPHDERP